MLSEESNKKVKEFDYEIIDNWLWLKYIEVHSKYRGKGYGEKIMKEIFAYCARFQLNVFLYPANSNTKYLNRLINFYSRCGMVKHERDGFIIFVYYYDLTKRPPIPLH